AAEAIAGIITPEELHPDYIVPSVFNREVARKVADAVIRAAVDTGVAGRERIIRSPESGVRSPES
ncbi:MAG: hypothetical protein J2P31_09405, partial [Blastocatellia bacterium]|nr:hypothetical protein [Blastocatellia bacterium]